MYFLIYIIQYYRIFEDDTRLFFATVAIEQSKLKKYNYLIKYSYILHTNGDMLVEASFSGVDNFTRTLKLFSRNPEGDLLKTGKKFIINTCKYKYLYINI